MLKTVLSAIVLPFVLLGCVVAVLIALCISREYREKFLSELSPK